jgi:hypothetical protein
MPNDPYIREKYTKERTVARRLAAEYFQRFPKDRYKTEIESWRELPIAEYRVHHEAIEGPGRERLTRIFAAVFISYRHA